MKFVIENLTKEPSFVELSGAAKDLDESLGYRRTSRDVRMEASRKGQAVTHARGCEDENCEICQTNVDEGFVISCDSCGFVEHTDWKWWRGVLQPDGGMLVFCDKCHK